MSKEIVARCYIKCDDRIFTFYSDHTIECKMPERGNPFLCTEWMFSELDDGIIILLTKSNAHRDWSIGNFDVHENAIVNQILGYYAEKELLGE